MYLRAQVIHEEKQRRLESIREEKKRAEEIQEEQIIMESEIR